MNKQGGIGLGKIEIDSTKPNTNEEQSIKYEYFMVFISLFIKNETNVTYKYNKSINNSKESVYKII